MISILNSEIQKFINQNLKNDFHQLSLKKNPFPEIDYRLILQQIESKNKAKTKIPTWYNTENLIYPEKISLEQCSSEATARYKSSFLAGKKLIDLTGGMGVDTYFLSHNFENVFHCEHNRTLSEITSLNFKTLNAHNIQCFAKDGIGLLEQLNQKFDWIYIDPSRRDDAKRKVFLLEDCIPNVVEQQEKLFRYTDKILIKLSPMYDITTGVRELKNIKNIHIVALHNEVKEVLFELDKLVINKSVKIITANIEERNTQLFESTIEANQTAQIHYTLPLAYLYEPNVAVMKSQCFSALGKHYNLAKLHPNSHLYTHNDSFDFVGKVYKINEQITYNKHNIKALIGSKAVVKTRNFPESVEQLRKKWKIKEGSEQYYFFTTDINEQKIVLICQKI
ncbi:MAG: class I SAM-dependent methyltransferase [Bacteroidota bacterium]|nr:class I SAM-dependent methyltransferase [Bacteroidota bacterium]